MQERVKPKTKVTLDIDATLAAAAAAKGVDLASLLEQALAAQLQASRTDTLSEADLLATEAYNRYIAEHGTLADSLRNL